MSPIGECRTDRPLRIFDNDEVDGRKSLTYRPQCVQELPSALGRKRAQKGPEVVDRQAHAVADRREGLDRAAESERRVASTDAEVVWVDPSRVEDARQPQAP